MPDALKLEDSVFFAWTRVSRRSEQLSRHFGTNYKRYNRWGTSSFTLSISLVFNFFRTLTWVVLNRPSIIFTFNAHPFVTISAKIGTWITMKGEVIPDLHTAAYTDHFSGISGFLGRWIWKRCPVVLVHNKESGEFLENKIPELINRLFVLEDALPDFQKKHQINKTSGLACVLISRFAPDEPIREFLDAVSGIKDCQFYITGNDKKAIFDLFNYSGKNITFTGFVSESDYIDLLSSADFLSILTTRDLTLLSGGYEALALEKPVILSKTETLQNYFSDSAIYTNNTVNEIQDSVRTMIQELKDRAIKIQSLKKEKTEEWSEKAEKLVSILNSLK